MTVNGKPMVLNYNHEKLFLRHKCFIGILEYVKNIKTILKISTLNSEIRFWMKKYYNGIHFIEIEIKYDPKYGPKETYACDNKI